MAKTQTAPPAPPVALRSLTYDLNGDITLTLPGLGGDPPGRLAKEAAAAVEELKATEPAAALLAQRGLLEKSGKELAAAQQAAAEARAARGAALAKGADPAAAEAALKAALADVGLLSERQAALREAIAAREREVDEVWRAKKDALYRRLLAEAREGFDKAKANLSAALAGCARELAEAAAAVGFLAAMSDPHSFFFNRLPSRPLGNTPAPPPPPADKDSAPRVDPPPPPLPRPLRCPHCGTGCNLYTDFAKKETEAVCPACGPVEVDESHELHSQLKKPGRRASAVPPA